MSQPRSDARRETRRPRSSATIDSVSSARQRTRAQTTAYLLGIRPELPDITDTAEQYQAPELDKSKLCMQRPRVRWRCSRLC